MDVELEYILPAGKRSEIAEFLDENGITLEILVEIALKNRDRASWRAAWIVQHRMEKNDPKLQPFAFEIINSIPNRPPGHQRELLKILLQLSFDSDASAYLFDICVGLWRNAQNPPGLRFSAMKTLLQLTDVDPDFGFAMPELMEKEILNTLTDGIRRAVERRYKIWEKKRSKTAET